MRPLHLWDLSISNIATCCKHLRKFLDSCGSELSGLTLDRIDFARFSESFTFFEYLSRTANLRSCLFRELNFGGKGLRFGVLNRELAHASSTRGANPGSNFDSELNISGKEKFVTPGMYGLGRKERVEDKDLLDTANRKIVKCEWFQSPRAVISLLVNKGTIQGLTVLSPVISDAQHSPYNSLTCLLASRTFVSYLLKVSASASLHFEATRVFHLCHQSTQLQANQRRGTVQRDSAVMAATLPGLPAELLLKIIRECDIFGRRAQFQRLRATSKKIDDKIIRFYGQEWYKAVYVRLCDSGLTRLITISQGQLAFHVEAISISCDTLLDEHVFNTSSESSDAKDDPWYEDNQRARYGRNTKIAFDETNFSMLMNGTVAQSLGSALPKFPNMKRVSIYQPLPGRNVNTRVLEQLQWRWTLALKVLISAVLSRAVPLQELSLYDERLPGAAHPSVLEHMGMYATQLKAIRTLRLSTTGIDAGYENDHYMGIMGRIMHDATYLEDLDLGFGHNAINQGFFKQLSKMGHNLRLRRLQLRQLRTRKKYLKIFLRLTKHTLKALVLDHIYLEHEENIVCFLWEEMNLKEVTLRCLHAGGAGIYFDNVSLERPGTIGRWHYDDDDDDDDDDWMFIRKDVFPQHKIELSEDDGDDIKHWLLKIDELSLHGDAWAKDDMYFRE
ncbi:hypothetical protein BKA63DRAFT_594795 [Paraphoma chrysanthemicola]|nr:hypothetical protein BKA63DRAFT_594795 [Paraphoma chrysanthemicola]